MRRSWVILGTATAGWTPVNQERVMRMAGIAGWSALAAVLFLGAATQPAKRMLVVCSPGSPGDTLQAQPTMDAFAAAAARAAGWPEVDLGAAYFEAAEAGREALRKTEAALALVSPPFYYQYAGELSLTPTLEAIPEAGAPATYSLVARKGAVKSPAALAGWEILGGAGFAPDFVRRGVLADWGEIPPETRISFSARPLSALRRAASGERVAALLDAEQTAALATLPFASELEIVHRSRAFPGGIFCVVRGRLADSRSGGLLSSLVGMSETEEGRAALKSIRVQKFTPLDARALPALLEPGGSPRPSGP